MNDCIFCKIIAGNIPCQKVFEDDDIFAFKDLYPKRQVHILGSMLAKANEIATAQGSPDGFRVIINSGRVGNQEVPHLHMHVVGGPDPVGPMLKRV